LLGKLVSIQGISGVVSLYETNKAAAWVVRCARLLDSSERFQRVGGFCGHKGTQLRGFSGKQNETPPDGMKERAILANSGYCGGQIKPA